MDIDEFHVAHDVGDSYFLDVHRYYYIYGDNNERDYIGEYVNLSLTKDNFFSLRIDFPCKVGEYEFPICDQLHYDEGGFIINISGQWDFAQSYYEYNYGNNNRKLEIVGNLFLEVENSHFEEHIGNRIIGDYSISCDQVMGYRYSELTLKFSVHKTDSIRILFTKSGSL